MKFHPTLAGTVLLGAALWHPAVPAPGQAAAPVVSNVSFAQRTDGTGLVDVTYDVADADGDTLAITLQASDDGGLSWIVPCYSVTGDAGPGVTPGSGKSLAWDLGADMAGWEGQDYQVRVIASDLGVTFAPHSPANVVVLQWAAGDYADPALIERFSRADLLVLTAHEIWNEANENLDVIARIKALNPDCVIVGYVPGKDCRLSWTYPWAYPFGRTWFERTQDYWSYTTEGDTLQDWPGVVVLNILEPECRAGMVNTIVEFQRNAVNKFDGVFWDYFNNQIWIPHDLVDVDGEADLDGDGIPMDDDPDERAAYRAACTSLVTAVRDSLGEGFIQIFNGQRAYSDSAFAALSDGLFYELFPTLFFPEPQMVHALDPGYPYSLPNARRWVRTQNGGPYIILSSIRRSYYFDHNGEQQRIILGDLFRAVALLTDVNASWNDHGAATYGWSEVDVSLGPPVGPMVIDGDTYSRDFKFGRVEVFMGTGNAPYPFDFRILINGRVVQEVAIPYHYP